MSEVESLDIIKIKDGTHWKIRHDESRGDCWVLETEFWTKTEAIEFAKEIERGVDLSRDSFAIRLTTNIEPSKTSACNHLPENRMEICYL